MIEVSSKELQRRAAAILDDLESGRQDRVVITRNGKPSAEMRPAEPTSAIGAEALSSLTPAGIDADQFFADIDEGIDQTLGDES